MVCTVASVLGWGSNSEVSAEVCVCSNAETVSAVLDCVDVCVSVAVCVVGTEVTVSDLKLPVDCVVPDYVSPVEAGWA